MALRAVEGRSGWPKWVLKGVTASGICPGGLWKADCPGRKITKCGAGPYRPETPTDCRGGRATKGTRRRSMRDAAASYARAPPPRDTEARRLRAGCGGLWGKVLLARPLQSAAVQDQRTRASQLQGETRGPRLVSRGAGPTDQGLSAAGRNQRTRACRPMGERNGERNGERSGERTTERICEKVLPLFHD